MAIGCAERYSALLVRQAGTSTLQGNSPTVVGEISEILEIEWRRTLSATSTARIRAAKCPTNCAVLGIGVQGVGPFAAVNTGPEPWAHEIWIYRDDVLVWCGPLLVARETTSDVGYFELQAWDISGWTARRVIDAFYSNSSDPATIAFDLATTFFTIEDPEFTPHLSLLAAASGSMSIEYDSDQYTIAQKWSDLVKAGMNYTTIGRYTIIFGQKAPNNGNPFVIDATDIIGDLELLKDGTEFGTRVFGLGEGIVSTITLLNSYWGLVDYPPVRFSDVQVQTDNDSLTQVLFDKHYDLSPQLVIPSGSSLSAGTEIFSSGLTIDFGTENPVGLSDLICGMRYDIQVSEGVFCQTGRYPMRLDEIQTTWTPEEHEKIAISMTTLGPGEVA